MLPRLRVDGGHVDLLAREELRNVAQQSLAIARLDDDVDRKQLVARRAPIGLDQPLRLARADAPDVRTGGAMDRDPLAARDEAHDRVGGRGLAASREPRQQPVHADDENAVAAAGGTAAPHDDLGLGARRRRRGGLRDGRDRGLHLPAVDLVAGERGEEILGFREAGLRGHRVELERGLPEARELALDHHAPLRDRHVELLRLEPLPDLGARAMALHVAEIGIEPVARRTALLRRDDLHLLTVLQHVVERHHLAVDARAAAAVPEARVHRVREVDRGRALRQVDDLALRCQHVDRVGEEAALERCEPFARVRDGVLPREDLPQPRDLVVEAAIAALRPGAAFLVAPVRRDAVLRMPVHLAGADLHLERLALGPQHGGVQRAVVVRLRLRDVIVELAR